MEEREIDLKQIIWKVILSWRAMIVWGVLVACALTGLMYVSDSKKYDKKKEDMENASNIEKKLDAEELSQVKSIIDYIDELDELRDYRDNAPIMKIDPYNAKSIMYQFYVKVDYSKSDSALTVDQDGYVVLQNDVSNITKVYDAYLNSDEFLNEVIKSMKYDVAPAELRDIIVIDIKNGIIDFSIYYTDDMSIDELSNVIIDALEAKKDSFADVSEFDISVVNEERNTERKEYLIDKKSSINAKIVDLEAKIKSLKTGLNSAQLYYIDRVRPKEELKEAAIQIKFVVIGFVLGVFLVCAFVFVKGAMSSKLALADELESLFKLNILGVLVSSKKKKRFLQFIDNALLKIKNRRVKQLSSEKRLEFATTSIAIKCEQLETKKLFITGTEIEKIDEDIIEDLKVSLAKEGIEAEVIDNIYYDGKALKQCVECGYVLFIEKVGTSIYNEINNQVNKAKEYDLNIIGAIGIN